MRFTSKIRILSILLTIFLITIVWADSDPVLKKFSGIWEGSTVQESIPVDLTSTSGNGLFDFHFGPPYNCVLRAGEGREKDNSLILKILETSGNLKCDELWNGTIVLNKPDDDHIDIRIEDENGNPEDQARLKKK